ncbi:MAG: hypothetical protein IKU60_03460 [Clostridia bacterium]|nr:hypothetical protein [Clostridia bacterium]
MKGMYFTKEQCLHYIAMAQKSFDEMENGKTALDILKGIYRENFPLESDRIAEMTAFGAIDAIRELDYKGYKNTCEVYWLTEELRKDYNEEEGESTFDAMIAELKTWGVLYAYINQRGIEKDSLKNIVEIGKRGLYYRAIVVMVAYCNQKKEGFPDTVYILDVKDVAKKFFNARGLYDKANYIPQEIMNILRVKEDEYEIKEIPSEGEIILYTRSEPYRFALCTKEFTRGRENLRTVKIKAKCGGDKFAVSIIEVYDDYGRLCEEPKVLRADEYLYCIATEGRLVKFLPAGVVIDADNYLARQDLTKGEVCGRIKGREVRLYGEDISCFDFDKDTGGYIYINEGVAVGFNQPYTTNSDAMHWRNESLYNGGAVEVKADGGKFGILYSNGYGHGALDKELSECLRVQTEQ